MALTWLVEGALPEAEARWAMKALLGRFERTLSQMQSLNIDGELKPCKGVLNAESLVARDILLNMKERMAAHGLSSEWVEPEAALQRYGCTGRGALVMDSHSIHPAKLAWSLAREAARQGIEIYENVTVESLVPSDAGVVARTAEGQRIRARRCVVAANAWAKALGLGSEAVNEGRTASCTMIASAPLSEEVLAHAGADQEALVAELAMSMSYRRIHNGRLLYGGFDDSSRGALSPPTLANAKKLAAVARKEMPWLKDTAFEFVWSGPIFTPGNDLPSIAPVSDLPGTAVVTGNAASGVPWALVAGGLVAGIIEEGDAGDAEGERLRHAMLETRIPIMGLAGVGVRAVWHALTGQTQ
jgi:glycine/D-amino acid oxidase-like deaminating enzyme